MSEGRAEDGDGPRYGFLGLPEGKFGVSGRGSDRTVPDTIHTFDPPPSVCVSGSSRERGGGGTLTEEMVSPSTRRQDPTPIVYRHFLETLRNTEVL